jgi:hypothetical protein
MMNHLRIDGIFLSRIHDVRFRLLDDFVRERAGIGSRLHWYRRER